MNDLYLIGNGFDLAHGLKTSYNDFLLWYFKRAYLLTNPGNDFSDELISFHRRYTNQIGEQDSISTLMKHFIELEISIKYKHDFFRKLVETYRDNRWVDIEYEYYSVLVKHYKEIELNPQRKESILKIVANLNFCLDFIKRKLVEYLGSIEVKENLKNDSINNILFEGTGKEGKGTGKKLYVNFNYTNTIDMYTKDQFLDLLDYTVYIHGKLNDEQDHIIFGYGDEIDPNYEKIENLNANEFLENIKSFDYLKTDDYQYVIRFLEEDEFCVKVLGHSCGLSDRILLKTIFEHAKCKAIKIFYYKKEDYREKTQEISRHFGALKKEEMRMKIVTFDKAVLMPQNKTN